MIENITVNEQSSIRIAEEKVLYFDPLHISDTPHDADIVFITHEHFDHFSVDDISRVAKADTLFVLPESMADSLKKANIPEEKVTLLKPGDSASVGGVAVEAVPAYNNMKPFHPKKNGWLGYVVTIGGKRVYVCGDTDDTPEARTVKCDIVCVPIGGTFTMDAKKAAELVNAISPEIAVPIHYGTIVGKPIDADKFEGNVNDSVMIVKKLEL